MADNLENIVARAANARQLENQQGSSGKPAWLDYLVANRAASTGYAPLGTASQQRIASDEGLSAQAGRYETNQSIADALKTKGLQAAATAGGVLSPILNVLDLPRAAVYATGREISDAVGGTGASAGDWLTRVKEHQGIGDVKALKYVPGESIAMRTAKATGAFLGDLATDPLTYLTLGVAPIARKVGAELVEKGVREAATAAAEQAAKNAAKTAGARADAAAVQDVSKFSSGAAEAYLKGRSRGVRNYLKQELGDTAGEEAFSNLPAYAKGGFGLQVPFTSLKVGSIGAGGTLTDAIRIGDRSLGDLTGKLDEAWMKARTKIRTTDIPVLNAPGKFLANIGEDSKLYDRVLRDLYNEEVDSSVKWTYQKFLDTKSILKDATGLKASMVIDAADSLADFISIKDPALKQQVSDLFNDPAALKKAMDDPAMFGEKNVELAAKLYGQFPRMMNEARDAGINIGEIEDYLSLRLLPDVLEEKLATRKVTGSRVPGTGAGYTPTKGRRTFTEDIVDPTTGEVTTRFLTPKEINTKRAAEGLPPIAETNPAILVAGYVDSMTKLIVQKRTFDALKAKGILTEGTTPSFAMTAPSLSAIATPSVNQVMLPSEIIDGELAKVARNPAALDKYLSTLNPANPADIKEVDDLIKALIFIETDNQARSLLNATAKTRAADVASLRVEIADTQRIAQKAMVNGNAADAEAAQLKLQGLLSDLEDAITNRPRQLKLDEMEMNEATIARQNILDMRKSGVITTIEQDNALRAAGNIQYGQQGGVAVPEGLKNVFGHEAVVGYLENMYKLPTKGFAKDAEQALTEFMRFFRTGATVGRLSGFVARNFIGMTWQNSLAGVRGADYANSGKILNAANSVDFMTAGLERFEGSAAKTALSRMEQNKLVSKETFDRLSTMVDRYGKVLPSELASVRDEAMRASLSGKPGGNGYSLYEIYKASEAADIYDANKVLGLFEGEGQGIDNSVSRVVSQRTKNMVAPDKLNSELNFLEKAANKTVNIGFDVPLPNGRQLPLRPTQLTISLNKRTEQFGRTAAISAGMRKYGADDAGKQVAGLMMKAVHFDYQDLSEFERRVMRNVLPFWTWTKNNIPLQFRAIMVNPGKVNNLMRGWEAIQGIASDESGNVYFIPDWVEERYGFATKFRTGGDYPLMFSLESPLMDVNKYFNKPTSINPASAVDWQEFLTGTSPVIKAPAQFAFQKNLFTGAPYTESGVAAPPIVAGLDKLTGERLPGMRYNPEGERVLDQRYYDLIKETFPQLGMLERLVPGLGSPAQNDRRLTNTASGLLGLPLSTLTPTQEAGQLRGINKSLERSLSQAAGRGNLDYKKMREYASQVTTEQLIQLLDQGLFDQ